MSSSTAASFRHDQSSFLAYLVRLSDAYYNTSTPLVSDADFDALVEEYEAAFQTKYSYLGKPQHNKARLPVFMPSLNKCKDAQAITRFIQAEPNNFLGFVYSEKLDGVSLLVHYTSKSTKLYTRGDGTTGTDVSHILPYLSIPTPQQVKPLAQRGSLVVRGELLLPNGSTDESNLRNIVCGLVNAKTVNAELLRKAHFVAYGLPQLALKPSECFQQLAAVGFRIPCMLVREHCTVEVCNEIYDLFLGSTSYVIDGVVVAKDVVRQDALGADNPKDAMAFKRTNATRTTTVKQVVWQHSRYGTCHPQVEIEPVVIDGCTIRFISGNNARYIFTNLIGPGCIIEVQRSGEVIPNIVRVLQPAPCAQMPDKYEWDGVHIRQEQSPGVKRQQDLARLTHSMGVLGAKGVSAATIEKLYDAGYTTEVDMWNASIEDFMRLDGIQLKKSKNLVEAFSKMRENLDLMKLMLISACFDSFGERKLQAIGSKVNLHEYLLSRNVSDFEMILTLASASVKTQAQDFLKGCDDFRSQPYYMALLSSLKQQPAQQQQEPMEDDKKYRVCPVFTGFRPDDDMKLWCEKRRIKTNAADVTKKTDCVVAVDVNSTSSKVKTARRLGLPVLTIDEFVRRYES